MVRTIRGGEINRGAKAAFRAFNLTSALTIATLGIVACAGATDTALDAEPNAAESSTPLTPAHSTVDNESTEQTGSASEPTDTAESATTTSDSNATTTIGAESTDNAATNDDASAAASSSGLSTNDPGHSYVADENDQPALPAAEGPDYAFARGGTRLRAVHFTAPGTERFLHFFDPELARECAFEKIAGQSDYACAPVEPITVHYKDAACTQPIVLSKRGAYVPARPLGSTFLSLIPVPEDFVGSWVTTRGAVSCVLDRSLGSLPELAAAGTDLPARGEITAVYQVGESYALTPNEGSSLATVFELIDGACESTSAMVRIRDPADTAYLLEPRAIDDLVTAQLQTFDAGAEFDVQRLIGNDGSWQTVGAVDNTGEECELMADGRCVPGSIAKLSHVALFPSYPCSEPAVDVLLASGQHCGERYGIDPSGEPEIWELVTSAASDYYQQWQPIDPDTGEMLALECGTAGIALVAKGKATRVFSTAESVLVGEPALRGHTSVAAGTAISLRRDVDFVLEDGTSCDVNLFDDGVYRCHTPTPGEIDGVTYTPENYVQFAQADLYGDPECTQHVYMANGTSPDLPYWTLTTSFHAMAPFDGPFYQDYAGVCTPLEDVAFGNPVFVEGDELPVALPVVERAEL